MALFLLSRYTIFSLLCFSALSIESVDEKLPFSLSFEKFENDQRFGSQIALYGDADVRNSTVLMFGKGRMMCKKPVRFFGTNPGFSTYFSFSISAGYGQNLAFLLVPSNISQAEVNPRFLVVKFATNSSASNIVFDVGGVISVKSSSLVLNREEKLHSWIDYDGASKIIGVKISKSRDLKPEKSLVSCPVDLSNTLWRETMYVGISSSSESESASRTSSVYSWSFNVTHGAPYQMHSEPLNPESITVRSYEDPLVPMRRSSPWKIIVALFIGVIFGALLASAVFFLRSKVVKRHPVSPIEYESEKIVSDGFKVVDVAGK